MRVIVSAAALIAAIFLVGCAPAPEPAAPAKIDPTTQPWYAEAVTQLTAINTQANAAFHKGKQDQAAALIKDGQAISARLLEVLQPTLPAMQAASDLDDLYGRMLLSNRNYGWARLFFQKNLARWKHWKPETPDTALRLKQAESAIAECDRRMTE